MDTDLAMDDASQSDSDHSGSCSSTAAFEEQLEGTPVAHIDSESESSSNACSSPIPNNDDDDDDDESLDQAENRSRNYKTVRSVSSAVHDSLIRILSGESIPKKQRSNHDAAAYRIKGKRLVSLCRTLNPLSGSKELRIMVKHKNSGNKTILLKSSEIDSCIKMYYKKYKGAGARKLHRVICRVFTGVTERDIQAYINSIPKQQRIHPKFTNKLPLKPVQSAKVLNQVQIDLVDMSASPSTADTPGVTYKYILVVLDVFSRFCFLRPLQSKSSSEIAQRLIEIFCDTGPPVRIQSDQGTEFKGCVKLLMQAMGVKIIYSRPYHPQAQGKVERSHRTWKSYLFFDVVGDYQSFMKNSVQSEFGWADNLPVYQHIYNTTSHKSIEQPASNDDKHHFVLAPDFSSKPKETNDIFKYGDTEDDWKKDALDKAWKKEDIKDDKNSDFRRDWVRRIIKEAEPKWIHLTRSPQESFYYTKMKEEPKIYRVKDVLVNPWPLSDALPDMVDEIKHYMHGLTHIHLHDKGVVYKVKFAEDVLFNEAVVYLLQCRFNVKYEQAIEYHQRRCYPNV